MIYVLLPCMECAGIFFISQLDVLKFRAHHNYKNEGPWYDWAMIQYYNIPSLDSLPDNDGTPVKTFYRTDCFPAKILGFVSTSQWRRSNESDAVVNQRRHLGSRNKAVECSNPWTNEERTFAIIHCCDKRDKELVSRGSVLTENWLLEYRTIKVVQRDRDNPRATFTTEHHQPVFRLVPVSSIVDRVFVMEENPGFPRDLQPQGRDKQICRTCQYRSVHMLQNYGQWGNKFV